MKLGRFHIEYYGGLGTRGWRDSYTVTLYCGCFRYILGPFTLEYVRHSSKCYPNTKCTHGRIVVHPCGHEFWTGWGIAGPGPDNHCPQCKYGDVICGWQDKEGEYD